MAGAGKRGCTVRLGTRLDRLERDIRGDPARVREWEAFLTAVIAFGQERADVTPEMAARIREEARYYAGRGIPATIVDWFRELHAIAEESEAHG
jgi:hypothetical protein